jgi:hypothetical protein
MIHDSESEFNDENPALRQIQLVACRSRNISTASYGRGSVKRVRY